MHLLSEPFSPEDCPYLMNLKIDTGLVEYGSHPPDADGSL